jgi:hypothetical protein
LWLDNVSGNARVNGHNPLISRKTVSFSFSEPYDFALSFLNNSRFASTDNPLSRSDNFSQSTKWCTLIDYLRTFFEKNMGV